LRTDLSADRTVTNSAAKGEQEIKREQRWQKVLAHGRYVGHIRRLVTLADMARAFLSENSCILQGSCTCGAASGPLVAERGTRVNSSPLDPGRGLLPLRSYDRKASQEAPRDRLSADDVPSQPRQGAWTRIQAGAGERRFSTVCIQCPTRLFTGKKHIRVLIAVSGSALVC